MSNFCYISSSSTSKKSNGWQELPAFSHFLALHTIMERSRNLIFKAMMTKDVSSSSSCSWHNIWYPRLLLWLSKHCRTKTSFLQCTALACHQQQQENHHLAICWLTSNEIFTFEWKRRTEGGICGNFRNHFVYLWILFYFANIYTTTVCQRCLFSNFSLEMLKTSHNLNVYVS